MNDESSYVANSESKVKAWGSSMNDETYGDHITGELVKPTVREKYHGNEQVHMASGFGMKISHVGRSFVHTHDRNLVLDKVLHVPQANKNLASIHRLTADNRVFLEFHPDCFLIKDQATRTILHQGKCEGGLYPLASSSSPNKAAYSSVKVLESRWLAGLGHLLSSVVEQILHKHCRAFVPESNKGTVCDACQ
jgi:hypothetical protein